MVGGIAIFLSELSRGLVKHGHDVRVVVPEIQSFTDYDQNQPYPIFRYPILRRFSSLCIGYHLLKQIIKKKPEILFLGHVSATRGLPVLLFSLFFRIPYVVLCHAGHLPISSVSKINKISTYTLLRNANLLLANSKYTLQLLIGRGFSDTKIRVLTPGVDTDYFAPISDENKVKILRSKYGANEMPLILNIGRLVPKKNQVRIVKAIAKLRERGIFAKCIIAGNGPEQDNLQKHIEELGIGDRVSLIGYAGREKVRELFQIVDIVVLPSIIDNDDHESFGIVAIESAACGKPVIVGSLGGQPETVIPGETGFVIDGDDVNAIEETIKKLIEDKDMAKKFGETGRKRAVEEFSWKKISAKAEKMLESLISD